MNIYLYLLGYNIRVAEVVRMGGWLGGRQGITLSFIYILSFGYATPGGAAEGCKLKNIWNGLLEL